MPGGNLGALAISGLTFVWAGLATAALLWPGLGQSHPDSQLPSGFAGERWQYEASQLVPLGIFIACGVLFYVLGAPTRRREVAMTALAQPTPAPVD